MVHLRDREDSEKINSQQVKNHSEICRRPLKPVWLWQMATNLLWLASTYKSLYRGSMVRCQRIVNPHRNEEFADVGSVSFDYTGAIQTFFSPQARKVYRSSNASSQI